MSDKGDVILDADALAAITAILKRGNDVQIQNRDGNVVVLEVKKTIKYNPR